MSRQSAEQWALVTAGIVIIALTGGAFWLSYAHLAEVAGQHGLGHSPARQWAWPASLDAAIIAGELLMLRAGLRKEVDWWAIALTATGSVGSIALNIAGVSSTGNGGSVPVLDYVVAAVPPTAALVAFGVLMRQIHQLVTHPADRAPAHATNPAPGVTPAIETGSQGTLMRGTDPVDGPNHSIGRETRSGGADQTSSSAADQPNTADADHTPTGVDHDLVPVPQRTNPADQQGAGHGTGTLRASVTAGQAADQAADHTRTTRPTPPSRRDGGDADHRVDRTSRHRSTADQRSDRTDHRPADQPPAGQDRKTADQPNTGPDHQRTTDADQTVIVRERPRTTGADRGEDEPVPMERLVELARTAALTEGRMTRRVIRPYLRAQSIQISNERFAELQTRLYQDPALAHLPRSQRKTR